MGRKPLFDQLWAYIGGENKDKKSMDMTRPGLTFYQNLANATLSQTSACIVTFQFFLSKAATEKTPLPTNKQVIQLVYKRLFQCLSNYLFKD